MAVYTKEDFKRKWQRGGVTFYDVIDCARAWGLYDKPIAHPTDQVRDDVLKAAECEP